MSTKNKGYPLPDLIDPATERGFCVPVPNDPAYLRAFWGQMSELGRWGMWHKDGSHKAVDAATRWRDSYSRITSCTGEECEECPDECMGDCGATITPENPLIDYAPNDPFRTPDHVPPGYLLPPWGLDEGRPAVGLDSLPLGIFNPIAILSGFPRFKVHCRGNGSALLYFRKSGNGGYAYVTVDGNPAGTIVDLASWSIFDFEGWADLLAPIIGVITGNENPREILEVELEGSGEHSIDVTFLPKLGGLFVLQGFGGQLEKVKICTDEPQEVIEEMPPQMRLQDCILQWRPNSDADWVDLGNVCGEDGTDGIDGEDGTCPDLCENNLDTPSTIDWYCRSAMVLAKEIYRQAKLEVARVEDAIDPTGFYSGSVEYMLPLSERTDEYFVETQGDWGVLDGDALDRWNYVKNNIVAHQYVITLLRSKLECLFKNEDHASSDYAWVAPPAGGSLAQAIANGADAPVIVPPAETDPALSAVWDYAEGLFIWFSPYANSHFADFINAINYEANLSPAFGEVPCAVVDCDPPPTFSHEFNFLTSDGGWVSADPAFYNTQTWVSGQGWKSGTSGSTTILGIKKTFSSRTITRFRVEYSTGGAAGSGGRLHKLNPSEDEWALNTGTGTFVSDQTGLSIVADDARVFVDSVGNINANFITKIIIEGDGTDPF